TAPSPSNHQAPGKHIYVSMPQGAKKQVTTAPETITELNPEERKKAFEEKAEAMFRRAQDFQQSSKKEEEAEVNTLYSKSLDDLKQEYSNWIHHQKSSRKSLSTKTIGIAAAVILLVASAVLATSYFSGMDVSPVLAEEGTGSLSQVPVSLKNPVKQNIDPPSPKKKITAPKTIRKNNVVKKPVSTTAASSRKKTRSTPAINKPVNNSTIPLPQLVKIKGRYKPVGRGVSASEITLVNNSQENLRVVAVDVVYYKADGTNAGRETIYFKNISPSQSMTLTAPANKKAEEVRYQLGLISSNESGIFYAMH
ncbi:MAG TPA: FxLYD domain-containing protein, partial [Flavisolibacter sp.]